MNTLYVLGGVCASLLLVAPSRAGSILIPMDQQINVGRSTPQSLGGNAIYNAVNAADNPISFQSDASGAFTRENLKGNGYFYVSVDPYLAGYGNLDLSAPGSTITFDARYYQDATNTNRYGDAPLFLRAYTYATDMNTVLGYKDFGVVYATQAPLKNLPYPDWTTVTVDMAGGTVTNSSGTGFNQANIGRIRWHGTDWAGKGQDFVDIRNLVFAGANVAGGGAAIPEPGSLALLAIGVLPLLRLRRKA